MEHFIGCDAQREKRWTFAALLDTADNGRLLGAIARSVIVPYRRLRSCGGFDWAS